MSFWRIVLGLLRKPSVGIPIGVAAVALGVLGFLMTPVRYISSETLVLTTPASGGTISQDPNRPNGLTNPLLNFDNGLRVTSAILIQAVNTPEALEAFGGATTMVKVDDGRTNPNLLNDNGPFIYVQVESPTPGEALATINRVVDRLHDDLTARQVALDAPKETYISLVPVVGAANPVASMAGRVKMAGLGFFVPLVGGLAVAYLLGRRSARRLESSQGGRGGRRRRADRGTKHLASPRPAPSGRGIAQSPDDELRIRVSGGPVRAVPAHKPGSDDVTQDVDTQEISSGVPAARVSI
jgi:hypothetical protein